MDGWIQRPTIVYVEDFEGASVGWLAGELNQGRSGVSDFVNSKVSYSRSDHNGEVRKYDIIT